MQLDGRRSDSATCAMQISRKQRQLSASLGLLLVSPTHDEDEDELLDERCYFPVPALDIILGRDYMDAHPNLKAVYRIVDKESYLDWGLTSDYDTTDSVGRMLIDARPAAQRFE